MNGADAALQVDVQVDPAFSDEVDAAPGAARLAAAGAELRGDVGGFDHLVVDVDSASVDRHR